MRFRRLARLAPAVLVALTSCTPEAVTEQGREIGSLYTFFLYAAAGVFALVASLIGWSIIRHRARPDQEGLPPQTHTNLALEVTWFALPTLLVFVLFFYSVSVSWRLGHEEGANPVRTIAVEAFQWGWSFDYGDGVVVRSLPDDLGEMVLPVGTPLRLELRSPDVVHSFYVPRFLSKLDVVPGRVNEFDVTIDTEGVFRGVCAEFCGLFHDQMDFSVKAVPPSEFETWLEDQSDDG